MTLSVRPQFSSPGTAAVSGVKAGRKALLTMGFTDVGLPRDTALVVGRTASTDPPATYVELLDKQAIVMTEVDALSDRVNGGGNYDGSLSWDLGLNVGWTAGIKLYVCLFDTAFPASDTPPLIVLPAIVVQA